MQARQGGANPGRDIDQPNVVKAERRCPFAMLGAGGDVRDGPAGEPAVEQRLIPMRQRSCRPQILNDSEAAARPQKPSGLAIEAGFVCRVADAFEGPDDIEAGCTPNRLARSTWLATGVIPTTLAAKVSASQIALPPTPQPASRIRAPCWIPMRSASAAFSRFSASACLRVRSSQ